MIAIPSAKGRATKYELSLKEPAISIFSPTADVIHSSLLDPAHSELSGVVAESHKLLLHAIFTIQDRITYFISAPEQTHGHREGTAIFLENDESPPGLDGSTLFHLFFVGGSARGSIRLCDGTWLPKIVQTAALLPGM
ncbi:hypothetical protein K470DRAFT_170612 [Piedraia hortae CBS 480.64]|uniref:Uncharacterized protein n=1 Tax=Piedraia hortae CBS 480.64 TaxID=1314780 RepID=A0A6A7BQH0_9PEZI|nr:hypothetical protein K470DRAFT_170612 [Piedraia hortae CBS 480.64]